MKKKKNQTAFKHQRRRIKLGTFIFKSSDDEMEAIGLGAPGVGDVLKRHEIGPRENVTDALASVTTR